MTWAPSDGAQDGLVMAVGVDVPATKWVWVGGTGSPVFTMVSGASLTFASVPAGTMLNIRVTRMTANGGATGVLALY